eukprot:g932.t1
MPKHKRKLDPWKHCVAGVTAGSVATFLLHPFDLVKTRYQVYDRAVMKPAVSSATRGDGAVVVPSYRSLFHALRTITKDEGFSAVYQGLQPAIFGSAVSWGLYFFFYENAKRRYSRWFGGSDADGKSESQGKYHLPVRQQLMSATEAGVTTVLITNPIWLAKTRLQIQMKESSALLNETAQGKGVRQYRGLVDTFQTIVKEEGFFGLYRGVGAALILTSHGTIQFFSYEYLKEYSASLNESGTLGHFAPIWIGALSKLVASTATYPYQVIKARIQQRQIGVKYNGILECAQKMVAREGWRSFYKGIGINTIRVMPQSAAIFYVYETIARMIGD